MKRHHRSIFRILRQHLKGPPRFGCEVGVWEGGCSEFLLRRFPLLTLLMVDAYRPYGEGYDGRMAAKTQADFDAALSKARLRVEFAGERAILAIGTSAMVADLVGDERLDFVFIDGDHSYESVTADLLSWRPTVRKGGIMLGHDYDRYGDRSGKFGVKRAVDDFARGKYKVRTAPGPIWWFKV